MIRLPICIIYLLLDDSLSWSLELCATFTVRVSRLKMLLMHWFFVFFAGKYRPSYIWIGSFWIASFVALPSRVNRWNVSSSIKSSPDDSEIHRFRGEKLVLSDLSSFLFKLLHYMCSKMRRSFFQDRCPWCTYIHCAHIWRVFRFNVFCWHSRHLYICLDAFSRNWVCSEDPL